MIGYVFQNNRSSAPPIVMMDGGGKRGLPVILVLIHTNHTEAYDEMRNRDRKVMEAERLFFAFLDEFRDIVRYWFVVVKFHVECAASFGQRPNGSGVTEHFRQRNSGINDL